MGPQLHEGLAPQLTNHRPLTPRILDTLIPHVSMREREDPRVMALGTSPMSSPAGHRLAESDSEGDGTWCHRGPEDRTR